MTAKKKTFKPPVHDLPGQCPKCGSNDLMYGDMDIDGDSLWYHVQCATCKTYFNESYALHFIANEIQ